MFFQPYEGSRYRCAEGFHDGLKLLVLGESHYVEGYDPVKDSSPRACAPFTKEVVEDFFLPIGSRPHYELNSIRGRLHRLLTGIDEPTEQQARDAWSKIAYANYIQKFVGDTALARKTSEHWRSGENALQGMLEYLAPDRVLIFGKATWNHIHHGRWLIESWRAGGRNRGLWGFDVRGLTVPATWVMHPSWGRDDVSTMREVLTGLMADRWSANGQFV